MNKIKFCDICGGILKPLKVETGETVGICKCGYMDMGFSLEYSQENKIEVIGEGVSKPFMGVAYPHKCKKCGHEESDAEIVLASYSDESDVYLYRCRKCKFTERQADGTSNK